MQKKSILGLGMGAVLLWLSGCADEPQQVKPSPRPYRGRTTTAPQQTDTPTVENTQERIEDIKRTCSRKAQTSSDISRCWMSESERRGAKKFEASVNLSILVGPDGKAQEVTVMQPNAEFKGLEACVIDVVKGWSFPSGETVAPATCNFLLRPIM